MLPGSDIMPKKTGLGSVSQRKDGTWTGRLYLGYTDNGKQKIKAVYGKTEKEVRKKLKGLQIELIKYDYSELPKLTLKEWLLDWMNDIKKNELKPASYDRLEATINNDIISDIGYLQIQSITAKDIQAFINRMVDRGCSYSTIKKAYNALNASMKMAVYRDYIRKNPCYNISLPKQKERSRSDIEFFKATPHKTCAEYAPTDFSSDCIEISQAY